MPVTINVRNLKVHTLDVDFHEISWELENTTEDVLDYTFQLLRSEAAEGPYDALTQPFEDRYSFIDTQVLILHRWRQFHYKLRLTHKESGDQKEFGPVAHEPQPDLVAIELRRHMRLLFREFAGRRCVVLPTRTFGQRCDCFDVILDERTRSGCVTCYDTGFVRGYMHPVETWMQIDPSTKAEQNQNTGTTHQDNTTARLGFYPPVKPRDLIIEPENKRWRVIQQNQTEQVRAAVHQEISIHRIPEADIEYKIPVHFEEALKNLFLSPSRNYTNPHNLEAFENEEIPGIFALYPTTYGSAEAEIPVK